MALDPNDAIVGDIYDTLVDADDPDAMIARLGDHLGTPTASLIALGDTPSVVAMRGYSAMAEPIYREHFHRVDPWLEAGRRAAPFVAVDLDHLVPHATLVETEFYRDFFRTVTDAVHCIGVMIDTADTRYSMTFLRAAGRSAEAERNVARLTRVLPHLHRALATRTRIAAQRARIDTLETLFDDDDACHVVVDSALRVLWSSASAPAGLPIVVRADAAGQVRLAAADASCQSALRRAIGAATATVHATSTTLTIGDALVFVDPLDAAHGGARRCVVRTSAAATRQRRAIARARQLYALTPAECALLATLATGGSVEDHAAAAGTSIATARSHVKNIFAKAGMNRQGQLIAQLHRLSG